jgi:hypothetical protein
MFNEIECSKKQKEALAILNALMTTDVASTLNWKGKGDKKSFEALNVRSIVKGKNNSLTNLLLFESLYLYKTCEKI